jgi:hypothetical protein
VQKRRVGGVSSLVIVGRGSTLFFARPLATNLHTSILVSLSFIIPHHNDQLVRTTIDAVIWLQSWFRRSAITSVHLHLRGFTIPPFIDILQTTCSGFPSIGNVTKKG